MTTNQSNVLDTIVPTKNEAKIAKKSSAVLSGYKHFPQVATIQMGKSGKTQQEIVIPKSVIRLISDTLGQMAQGKGVALLSTSQEITTQVAASILNVSRPYVIKLLKQGKIPYRMVGTRHRVLASDVIHYKEENDKARMSALEKLSNQAQKLNMGY